MAEKSKARKEADRIKQKAKSTGLMKEIGKQGIKDLLGADKRPMTTREHRDDIYGPSKQ